MHIYLHTVDNFPMEQSLCIFKLGTMKFEAMCNTHVSVNIQEPAFQFFIFGSLTKTSAYKKRTVLILEFKNMPQRRADPKREVIHAVAHALVECMT